MIGALFFTTVALFFPFFTLLGTLILTFTSVFWQLIFVVYLMLGDVFMSLTTAPFIMSGLQDVTEDAAHPATMETVDDDSGEALSSRKSLRKRKRVYVSASEPPLVYERKKNHVSFSTLVNMATLVYDNLFGERKRK